MPPEIRMIYVDLDHTLVSVDLLRERLLLTVGQRPFLLPRILSWLLFGGRTRLKTELAKIVSLRPESLPFNRELLSYLEARRVEGSELVLATAAPLLWAQSVAGHLGIFARILATDPSRGNLKGKRKLEAILEDAQGRPFAYAGDSASDQVIFEAAELPIVVGGPSSLAGARADAALVIRGSPQSARAWWKSLRPHQWSKNILVLGPALAAHHLEKLWVSGTFAFLAFSLVASAFYLLNDFYDIDRDREHPDKRHRAQATGALASSDGILLGAFLLLGAVLLSMRLPLAFGLILVLYAVLNTLYSTVLKHLAVLDLIVLAFLYCLRVFAGGAACGVQVSPWLIAFIFFVSLSLAHLKRYAELNQRLRHGIGSQARPTYAIEDIKLILTVGLAAGLLAVLVLALYITSPQTLSLYRTPNLLFLVCLFLFYWIERIWLLTTRDHISSDPIVFIATDPVSYLLALASGLVVWLATIMI